MLGVSTFSWPYERGLYKPLLRVVHRMGTLQNVLEERGMATPFPESIFSNESMKKQILKVAQKTEIDFIN